MPQPPHATQPQKPFRLWPWLLASVALHLTVVLVIVIMWGQRDDLKPVQRKSQLSAEKLNEAAHKLRDINRREIEQNLEQIEEMKRQMEELRDKELEKLAEQFKDRPAEAKEKALALLEEILAAQRGAIEKQDANAPLLAALASEGRELAKIEDQNQRLTEAKEKLADLITRMLEADKLSGQVRGDISRIQQLQVNLAAELAWLDDAKLDSLQKQANDAQEVAKQQANDQRARVEWVERDSGDAGKNVERALAETQKTKKQNDYQIKRGVEAITAIAGHGRVIADLQAQGRADEAAALAEQEKLVAALNAEPEPKPLDKEALKATLAQKEDTKPSSYTTDPATPPDAGDTTAATDPTTPATTEPATTAATTSEPTTAPNGENSLTDLYNKAVEAEKEATDLYGQILAAQTASSTGASPGQARASTAVANPERPALAKGALDGDVSTGGAYEKHTEALTTAVNETGSMVHATATILSAAKGTAALTTTPMTQAEADAANGQHSDSSGHGEAGGTDADGNPIAGKGEHGKGPGGKSWGPPDVGGGDDPAAANKLRTAAGPGRVLGQGTLPSDWQFIESWYLIGPFTSGNSADVNRQYTPENVVNLDGRYIGPDGRKLRWQFHRCANPSLMFPVQADYAVYYAFTQIRSETAREVWLALGADDGPRVWLNGAEIEAPKWHGEEYPWNFSFGAEDGNRKAHLHYRGFRLVRLKPGINSLLMRVENIKGGVGLAAYMAPAQ